MTKSKLQMIPQITQITISSLQDLHMPQHCKISVIVHKKPKRNG